MESLPHDTHHSPPSTAGSASPSTSSPSSPPTPSPPPPVSSTSGPTPPPHLVTVHTNSSSTHTLPLFLHRLSTPLIATAADQYLPWLQLPSEIHFRKVLLPGSTRMTRCNRSAFTPSLPARRSSSSASPAPSPLLAYKVLSTQYETKKKKVRSLEESNRRLYEYDAAAEDPRYGLVEDGGGRYYDSVIGYSANENPFNVLPFRLQQHHANFHHGEGGSDLTTYTLL